MDGVTSWQIPRAGAHHGLSVPKLSIERRTSIEKASEEDTRGEKRLDHMETSDRASWFTEMSGKKTSS